MLGRNREVDRLGGEIHRHQRGDVGDGEALAGRERSPAQSSVEIGEEILHPELATLCQLGNLLVIMRPGDRAAFETGAELRMASMTAANPSSSARRSHIATSAFSFAVSPSKSGVGWTSSMYRQIAGTSPMAVPSSSTRVGTTRRGLIAR